MDGLIVNLFKEPITTNYNNSDKNLETTGCMADYTVWMHYDFIKITGISEFEKYFFSDKELLITDDEHEGDRQSMHLYFLERDKKHRKPKLKIYSDPKDEGKIFYCPERIYNFACITTIKLNQTIETVSEIEEPVIPNRFHAELIKIIDTFDKTISKYEDDFIYDWYGSLGTEELVLIINADFIKVFTDIIEIIRMEKSTNQYLSSTYSFTFSNFHQISEQATNSKLDLDANISLTLNPSGNSIEYMDSITRKIYSSLHPDGELSSIVDIEGYLSEEDKIKFFNMIGKYDYYISIPKNTWNFLGEFNVGGLFNSETCEYQKNVFQIKTNWMYSDKTLSKYYDTGVEGKCDISPESDIDDYIKDIRDQIKELAENLPEYLKRARHIMRAIDLLYYDFKKNIRSIFAAEWSEDLYYQFKTFLDLLKNSSEDIEVQFSIIEESINSLRQTYIHITQASRMFFEIPATNLRYTGSFNKILRAYYGIVKQLLYIAYSVRRNSTQSMLIPIITFEYTTKVNTHIYSQTKDLGADRLVVFHLPYEALVDIPKYTNYLCHEVFHYIAPDSRYERNKLLSDISIFYYYHDFLKDILMGYILKNYKKLSDKQAETLVNKYIDLNIDTIKNAIEEMYKNFKIVNDADAYNVEDWFEKQSLKFFIESLEESFFSPADGYLERWKYNSEEFLTYWIKNARDFTTKEAEAICSSLLREIQFQPDLNQDSILEIFDLNKNKEKVYSEMSHMNKEYLSLKYKNNFIMRSEFIAYGMKEAKCDYFTIQIMQFDLDKYINFQFEFLYEHGVLSNILNEIDDATIIESSFMIRIGIICEYYRNSLHIVKMDQWERQIKACKLKEYKDEEQKGLFERFLNSVLCCYHHYLSAYKYYSVEILQNFLAETIRPDKICDEQISDVHLAKKEVYIYCSSGENQDSHKKFKTNIDMMERFQRQLSMKTLEKIVRTNSVIDQCKNKKIRSTFYNKQTEKNCDYVVNISSLSEFLQELKVISTFLKPKNPNTSQGANLLWYRGQTNKSHILLPGLMRNWKEGYNISPLEKEIALMDIFSSRTIHTMESDVHLLQNTFDWLVQMQHYGIPTNLLDWSENAFVALFFALIKKDDTTTKNDAAVYIMNPEYMELARETLLKDTKLEDLQRRLYPIVNFSKNCNDSNEDFIPLSTNKDIYSRASEWWNDDTGKSARWWPKPIISSLSNIRIRAQYGAFTVFNLMAKPCFGEGMKNNGYEYLSIENMQKEFLERYPLENPFLYKINIKKDFVEDIAKELKSAGYRIMNVYPELENISNAIVKQVETYFNE